MADKPTKRGSRGKPPAQETSTVIEETDQVSAETVVETPSSQPESGQTDFAELMARYDAVDLSEQEISNDLDEFLLGKSSDASTSITTETGVTKTNINQWSILKLAAMIKRVPAYTQYFFRKGSDMKFMSMSLRPENTLKVLSGLKLWRENKELFMDREKMRKNIARDPKWLFTVEDAKKYWNAVKNLSAEFSNTLFTRAVKLHLLIPALVPITNTVLGHAFNERIVNQLTTDWEELPDTHKKYVGGDITNEDIQHIEAVLFAIMGKAVKRGKLHKNMAVFLYLNKYSEKVKRLITEGYIEIYNYANSKGLLPGEESIAVKSLPQTTA